MPPLTLDDLARRTRCPRHVLMLVLDEWRRDGLAEVDDAGVWKLTPAGEPLGWQVLGALTALGDVDGAYAPDKRPRKSELRLTSRRREAE